MRPLVRAIFFGTYELALDGVPVTVPSTSKARSLLAYLALRRGESIRREALMEAFWPDADQTSARNNLKTTLSTIRRVFRDAGGDPDGVLDVERDTVRWIAATWSDVREFERCSAEIAEERRWALELYRGDFAPKERAPWAHELRERLAARFEHTLRMELRESADETIAERLLALDPFSDEAYTALIEAALGRGDRRRARAIFSRYSAALAELGEEPPFDLAARVGARAQPLRSEGFPFCGRSDELAQIESALGTDDSTIVVLCGIGGIGKSALAEEAARRNPSANVEIFDATGESLSDAQWRHRVERAPAAIVCVRTNERAAATAAFPQARDVSVAGLAREEVTLALRRQFKEGRTDLVDALWQRSSGHPLVLRSLVELARNLGEEIGAETILRLRLPREVELALEAQLREAGGDAWEVAVLLALEPQLDNDDLAALLDWTLQRAADARVRLAPFRYPVFDVIAVRSLSQGTREYTVERIAERLQLHEHPDARIRMADHLRSLRRHRAAARAYLEAASSYAAFNSWENAAHACESGIALLETATSREALDILRDLYGLHGRALYQCGTYARAVRSLESLLEVSESTLHAKQRTSALVTMGHALARSGSEAPAWTVARQALAESRGAGAEAELHALHLYCRMLRDRAEYDEVIALASEAFERAVEIRNWNLAMFFGNTLIEVSRRHLRLTDCFEWARRQREAAVLAGPMLEAEACFILSSTKFVVNRVEDAIEDLKYAQSLIEGARRRNAVSPTPAAQLEWMLHHGLSQLYNALRRPEEALAEVEWQYRSPWSFNTVLAGAQLLAVAVETRSLLGSPRDFEAARTLSERIAPAREHLLAEALDTIARARIGAYYGAPEAKSLLHRSFQLHESIARFYPDQVHVAFGAIATAARGIDDTLAAHSASVAAQYQSRVIEAAGVLWADDPLARYA